MKSLFFFLFVLGLSTSSIAQIPYTQEQYAYDSLLNIPYGTAIDYSGYETNLTMDIYKPKGDQNCKRPVLLLLHGGAWVVGNKEDISMKYISRQFAKRGWVVSIINYRLGTQKAENYSKFFMCTGSLSEPCAYISDSAEAIRANYRAMQDAKGAVRFMKNRNLEDSTDVNNVFMAGESAGAFTSFLVAFLDRESEKPELCQEIMNAPNPSSYFNNVSCAHNPVNLTRPDLVGINGDLNLGNYDASVRGIGSFFGAVFDLNIFEQNTNSPCVYLFAQGSDVIVHYNYGKLFERIDSECYNNFLCQNYDKYPHCYGNEGLRQYFEANTALSIEYSADIVDNYTFNNNCFVTGHAIDDPQLRSQHMADFFANRIAASGNNPLTNCMPTKADFLNRLDHVLISNSITQNIFNIHVPIEEIGRINYSISTQVGLVIRNGKIKNEKSIIDISNFSSGLYFVTVSNQSFRKTFKVVKQ